MLLPKAMRDREIFCALGPPKRLIKDVVEDIIQPKKAIHKGFMTTADEACLPKPMGTPLPKLDANITNIRKVNPTIPPEYAERLMSTSNRERKKFLTGEWDVTKSPPLQSHHDYGQRPEFVEDVRTLRILGVYKDVKCQFEAINHDLAAGRRLRQDQLTFCIRYNLKASLEFHRRIVIARSLANDVRMPTKVDITGRHVAKSSDPDWLLK
jgi:hypothetical protein